MWKCKILNEKGEELVVFDPDDRKWRGTISVGRSSSCGISLKDMPGVDRTVSRIHLSIVKSAGQWRILSAGHLPNLEKDGEPVSSASLYDGLCLGFGSCRIVVEEEKALSGFALVWETDSGLLSRELPIGHCVVGHSEMCDITVKDQSCSRSHAKIKVNETGEMVVTDLGSTNGTYVNGKRITESTVLPPGGLLQFGNVKARVAGMDEVPRLIKKNSLKEGRTGLKVALAGMIILAAAALVLFARKEPYVSDYELVWRDMQGVLHYRTLSVGETTVGGDPESNAIVIAGTADTHVKIKLDRDTMQVIPLESITVDDASVSEAFDIAVGQPFYLYGIQLAVLTPLERSRWEIIPHEGETVVKWENVGNDFWNSMRKGEPYLSLRVVENLEQPHVIVEDLPEGWDLEKLRVLVETEIDAVRELDNWRETLAERPLSRVFAIRAAGVAELQRALDSSVNSLAGGENALEHYYGRINERLQDTDNETYASAGLPLILEELRMHAGELKGLNDLLSLVGEKNWAGVAAARSYAGHFDSVYSLFSGMAAIWLEQLPEIEAGISEAALDALDLDSLAERVSDLESRWRASGTELDEMFTGFSVASILVPTSREFEGRIAAVKRLTELTRNTMESLSKWQEDRYNVQKLTDLVGGFSALKGDAAGNRNVIDLVEGNIESFALDIESRLPGQILEEEADRRLKEQIQQYNPYIGEIAIVTPEAANRLLARLEALVAECLEHIHNRCVNLQQEYHRHLTRSEGEEARKRLLAILEIAPPDSRWYRWAESELGR